MAMAAAPSRALAFFLLCALLLPAPTTSLFGGGKSAPAARVDADMEWRPATATWYGEADGDGSDGQLGAVAGHEARVGGHVVPGAGPAPGALLREADHAVRPEGAHGARRHPQELDAQGHLHLAPQLRAVSLGVGGAGARGPAFYRHPDGHCLVGPQRMVAHLAGGLAGGIRICRMLSFSCSMQVAWFYRSVAASLCVYCVVIYIVRYASVHQTRVMTDE